MSGGGNASLAPGQSIYTPAFLSVYDWLVLRFAFSWAWGCPKGNILDLYRRFLSSRHLDVGVGTGFFLDQTGMPGDRPSLSLLDLSATSLTAAARRLRRFRPSSWQADVMSPLLGVGESFDSVALCSVLHCMPGSLAEKAARAFANLRPLMSAEAVLFGCTILGSGIAHPLLGRLFLQIANGRGVFDNLHDDQAGLEHALRESFPAYQVWLCGRVALFAASGSSLSLSGPREPALTAEASTAKPTIGSTAQVDSGRDGAVRRHAAPGPSGHLLVGLLPEFRRDVIETFVRNWHEYGDTVRLPIGGRWVAHLLVHPDQVRHVLQTSEANYVRDPRFNRHLKLLLGDGLLTSNGEVWQRQRQLVQPALHRQRVLAMVALMTAVIDEEIRSLESVAGRRTTIDVARWMMSLTLRVAARTLLGTNVASNAETMRAAGEIITEHINERMLDLVHLDDLLPLPSGRRYRRALRDLDTLVYQVIAQRERAGTDGSDLLSMLLEARDSETGEAMRPKELRDEVMTTLFAANETTANALAWACFMLSTHPDVQRRMVAEIDEVLGHRTPTADDLARLPFTRMVLQETLRLFPPAWAIARVAVKDDVVGGFHMPAGGIVFLSPFLTHRHPEFWDDPEAFDPQRFQSHRVRPSPFAYLPFGAGPRRCVGAAFAEVEATLVLAMLAQRVRLSLVPGIQVRPKPLVALRPGGGLPMTVARRVSVSPTEVKSHA